MALKRYPQTFSLTGEVVEAIHDWELEAVLNKSDLADFALRAFLGLSVGIPQPNMEGITQARGALDAIQDSTKRSHEKEKKKKEIKERALEKIYKTAYVDWIRCKKNPVLFDWELWLKDKPKMSGLPKLKREDLEVKFEEYDEKEKKNQKKLDP
jgi:hypothetical protein